MKTERSWEEALHEVRRAYRLVAIYQRRVLDLLRLTADAFDQHRFVYWKSVQTDEVPKGKKNPTEDAWSWDFLPLSEFSILLCPDSSDPKTVRPGETLIEISVRTDNAFEAPDPDAKIQAEPDPMKWDKAEESDGEIQIICWAYQGKVPLEASWKEVWDNIDDYPDEVEEVAQVKEYDGMRCMFLEVDLVEFLGSDDPRPLVDRVRTMVADNLGVQI